MDLIRVRAELHSARRRSTSDADWRSFEARFDTEFPRLQSLFHRIYGPETGAELLQMVLDAAVSWQDRPADLKASTRPAQWLLTGSSPTGCSAESAT
ncbi:UNVERIFIED_ORG: hypothetical protein J2X79_004328 [Arthrobacter globiformis]|nr:hypothetical protein [Arthrobacter globiformis]